MPKTAVVAGSTGLVGNHLIQILAQSHEYEAVIALVRKGSNVIYDGVFTVEVDYQRLADFAENLQADDVYCCLGTTMKKAGSKASFYQVDYTFPFELAMIAGKNGSARFNIVTASGANSASLFYYNRVKGDIEKAIMKLNIPNINIFRPSLLLGNRSEKRMGEQVGAAIAKLMNPVMLGRLRRYRAIKGANVAKAMYRVSQLDKTGAQIYESDKIYEISQD